MAGVLAAAAVLGVLTLLVGNAPAQTQQYPTRPVRLVVPFPPGGGVDLVGRIVALKLSEALGQSIVVDNRSGAGGTIATDIAAKAPPDGHTLLMSNISLAVNATLYPKLPYNTLKDLAPVTLVGDQANILVVHPSVPAKSVRELLALVRSRPGRINYGSGGFGTSTYLATELLKLATRVEMVHVPYKGLGPALMDLVGGRVQLIISTMASAVPLVKAGKLRALAVTTIKRSSFFPELPTMNEAGVSGYEFSTWYGLLVPAGTPKAVISRLNAEISEALRSTAVKEQFGMQGLEPVFTSPGDFAVYLKAEVEKWGKVIKATGARPE